MGLSCLICKKPTYKKFKNQASFHSFPKCPIQRKVWMNMCNIKTLIDVRQPRLCSFHFEPECFEKNKKTRLLKTNAVPTIFVRRFLRKEIIEEGILIDTPSIPPSGRNYCILCAKSEISYHPRTRIPLHAFPICQVRRQEWINRCQLTEEEILPNNKICALHFEHECYKPDGLRTSLYPDAVPTIFEMGRYYNRKKSSSGKIMPNNNTN